MSNENVVQPPMQGGQNPTVTPKQMVDGKLALNKELLYHIREEKQKISTQGTPKPYIKSRPDGLDYVEEKYMRDQLNEHYPVWSWEIKDTQFLGSEWVIVTGELQILDNSIPRKFGSIGATRIQFKKNKEHTPDNVVDIDKNVASANTSAFKRAINRLCNICDDVYRKQVEDFALNEEQTEEILSVAKKISKVRHEEIKTLIEEQGISTINLDAAVRKLKQEVDNG